MCRTLSASTRSSAWFVSKVGLSAVSSYFITSHCMWDAGGCLCLTNFLSFYCSTSLSFFLSTYHKVMRERHKLTCFSANLASPLFWHFCDELASELLYYWLLQSLIDITGRLRVVFAVIFAVVARWVLYKLNPILAGTVHFLVCCILSLLFWVDCGCVTCCLLLLQIGGYSRHVLQTCRGSG